jgi:hypothetical protein
VRSYRIWRSVSLVAFLACFSWFFGVAVWAGTYKDRRKAEDAEGTGTLRNSRSKRPRAREQESKGSRDQEEDGEEAGQVGTTRTQE